MKITVGIDKHGRDIVIDKRKHKSILRRMKKAGHYIGAYDVAWTEFRKLYGRVR